MNPARGPEVAQGIRETAAWKIIRDGAQPPRNAGVDGATPTSLIYEILPSPPRPSRACALALPASVHAAKDPAKKGSTQSRSVTLGKYDKDSDGKILGDEAVALQKDYEADKEGSLKRFDTNADGKLDSTEIGAIRAGKKGGKKKKAV